MPLTVHGDPGTAVAAVYDRLVHARAPTYTPTHIQTDTALQRAQDGVWVTEHHSARTMIERFLVHLVGRSKRTTMSIAKTQILTKSYISLERTIKSMVTQQSELK